MLSSWKVTDLGMSVPWVEVRSIFTVTTNCSIWKTIPFNCKAIYNKSITCDTSSSPIPVHTDTQLEDINLCIHTHFCLKHPDEYLGKLLLDGYWWAQPNYIFLYSNNSTIVCVFVCIHMYILYVTFILSGTFCLQQRHIVRVRYYNGLPSPYRYTHQFYNSSYKSNCCTPVKTSPCPDPLTKNEAPHPYNARIQAHTTHVQIPCEQTIYN